MSPAAWLRGPSQAVSHIQFATTYYLLTSAKVPRSYVLTCKFGSSRKKNPKGFWLQCPVGH